jgi:hypothetical protein
MWCKSTKFVYELCGLDPLGTLAPVDIATLSCFNHDFLRIFTQTPCLFHGKYSSWKYFMNLCKKLFNKDIYIRLVVITINYHGIQENLSPSKRRVWRDSWNEFLGWLNLWRSRILNLRSLKVANPWRSRILNLRSPEVAKLWRPGILNLRSPEVANLWRFGILSLRSPEVTNLRRSGILNLRNSEIGNLWNSVIY